jgi:hypothetical protein
MYCCAAILGYCTALGGIFTVFGSYQAFSIDGVKVSVFFNVPVVEHQKAGYFVEITLFFSGSGGLPLLHGNNRQDSRTTPAY